jgi:hypothetical protein
MRYLRHDGDRSRNEYKMTDSSQLDGLSQCFKSSEHAKALLEKEELLLMMDSRLTRCEGE